MVLPKDDSVHGLVGRYFKLTMAGLFLYVLTLFFTKSHAAFLPIAVLEQRWLQYAGIALMMTSFIWVVVAQYQMQDSWRIGIDTTTRTALISTGLFSISRNPVFLGMLVSLLGLFLTTPGVFTLLFLVVGYVLIQIQVRSEEVFLTEQHGIVYARYQQRTKRFL